MTHCTQHSTQRQSEPHSAQRVITRHNGLVFYGLAAASFLETAAPLHANALLDIFAADQEARRWIEQNWWPVKTAHARETRTRVEALWPEFDWSSAYGEFYETYRPLVCSASSDGSPACEALARSVSAAQAAAFYRCLGTATDDPEVRQLLYGMSCDEAANFAWFRHVYERHRRSERLGLLAIYRTIVNCTRRARDVDVQLAFSRLNASHWYGGVPFPELEYTDFVSRMGEVVRRHLPLGPAQRLLFRPWLRPRPLPPARVPAAAQRGSHVWAGQPLRLSMSPR